MSTKCISIYHSWMNTVNICNGLIQIDFTIFCPTPRLNKCHAMQCFVSYEISCHWFRIIDIQGLYRTLWMLNYAKKGRDNRGRQKYNELIDGRSLPDAQWTGYVLDPLVKSNLQFLPDLFVYKACKSISNKNFQKNPEIRKIQSPDKKSGSGFRKKI